LLGIKSRPSGLCIIKYHFIILFPIAPKALCKYREAFTQHGAKDDPTDAFLQLDYLIKHPEVLKPLIPDNVETRILTRLVEDRRTLVADKVRLTNRITAALLCFIWQNPTLPRPYPLTYQSHQMVLHLAAYGTLPMFYHQYWPNTYTNIYFF